ncbi:MAG: DNA-binding protein [Prevotellaceae bacterium]|nr:DNA-binding protein [Prevotellaceae bacterium]
MKKFSSLLFFAILLCAISCTRSKNTDSVNLEADFKNPPASAKSWTMWYWMNAAVSREGITADLEAMKEMGLGGAYLMPVYDKKEPAIIEPAAEQMSPLWWDMVRHAMSEADRLGLKLAMHACDGFAVAGGPWITPEMSMQKVVWTETKLEGGKTFSDTLKQPESVEGFYKDIAVYAYPTPDGAEFSTEKITPKITSSEPNINPQFLVEKKSKETFRGNDSCWILYEFEKPFTCRSITVRTGGRTIQAHRLMVEKSNDGKNFSLVQQLVPPRHGWQNFDVPTTTHSIATTTARYFRFSFNKAGSEPGAEDLDDAKWKPNLKISGLDLSGEATINQYEGKSAQVWRVSQRTTAEQAPTEACMPLSKMQNISDYMDKSGRLNWNIPEGKWTILRMGHTSTGHTNATGGAAKGLECDKFNAQAIQLQFDSWFGEIRKQLGNDLANRVLKGFHHDSWECSSQNWSDILPKEFKKRRGYDMLPYLPVMTGLPVENADVSERFLHDLRLTLSEMVVDIYYTAMAKNARKVGCWFSSQVLAPTMMSEGLAHFQKVDITMGEFWLNSPTHDKPNDMLDAISGAHIYGKNIVQAEGFTELRMAWNEHPAMLKSLGDRAYANGINRMAYHVFVHNPFIDKKPGVTLNGVGLYFQRNQTWWKPGRAWVEYAERCQLMLQQGKPVVDIAVFTGEELPSRSVLPERLTPSLPGIVGQEMVDFEAQRLANIGQPQAEKPAGVSSSANYANPANYTDMLRGYKYDSFNKDALIRLAKVENGRIILPGGASYAMLVLPQKNPLVPSENLMSAEVAEKLLTLIKSGATVLVGTQPEQSISLANASENDKRVKRIAAEIWGGDFVEESSTSSKILVKNLGKGRVVRLPYQAASFDMLGLARDVTISESGRYAKQMAWTHRRTDSAEIYFISNQKNEARNLNISLRANGKVPEIWNAVTGDILKNTEWKQENGRAILPLKMPENGSVFVVLRSASKATESSSGRNWAEPKPLMVLDGKWQVAFGDSLTNFDKLSNWSQHESAHICHFSGTARYTQKFTWVAPSENPQRMWLDLGRVANLATVTLNGQPCGTAWTTPYRVDIAHALRTGANELTIDLTNTWANALIGDYAKPENERKFWTLAPEYLLKNKPLQEAGLLGEVRIVGE